MRTLAEQKQEASKSRPAMYEGVGDLLMQEDVTDRIILVPDAHPRRPLEREPRIRIMWGQHLLEDLRDGHYRALICAVNTHDNSRGIISQVAALSGATQWDAESITAYAHHVARRQHKAQVLKFDMDAIEVLAILRRSIHPTLPLAELAAAMRIVAEMLQRRPERQPAASVSFLEARVNHLEDADGNEPSFEKVLATMYAAGFRGDVYPAPGLWQVAPTGVFARYPFPASLDLRRNGGS